MNKSYGANLATGKQLAFVWIPISILLSGCGKNHQTGTNNSQLLEYTIIEDSMGSHISIGIPSDIDEQQVRATLAKAADEHQDDPARDYLTSLYLSVDAYLVKEGHQSSIPAGSLRRYAPLRNPAARKHLNTDRRPDDAITITLEEARRALGRNIAH